MWNVSATTLTCVTTLHNLTSPLATCPPSFARTMDASSTIVDYSRREFLPTGRTAVTASTKTNNFKTAWPQSNAGFHGCPIVTKSTNTTISRRESKLASLKTNSNSSQSWRSPSHRRYYKVPTRKIRLETNRRARKWFKNNEEKQIKFTTKVIHFCKNKWINIWLNK